MNSRNKAMTMHQLCLWKHYLWICVRVGNGSKLKIWMIERATFTLKTKSEMYITSIKVNFSHRILSNKYYLQRCNNTTMNEQYPDFWIGRGSVGVTHEK